jgi:hypothetical protein
MAFSRKVVILTSLYSVVSTLLVLGESIILQAYDSLQTQAVIFIVLSMLSILSYRCVIESAYTLTPSAYMMHLQYFKSHHCESDVINWRYFGIENADDVKMIKSETSAVVQQTFIISVLYLIFNCGLLMSGMIVYCKNYTNMNELHLINLFHAHSKSQLCTAESLNGKHFDNITLLVVVCLHLYPGYCRGCLLQYRSYEELLGRRIYDNDGS